MRIVSVMSKVEEYHAASGSVFSHPSSLVEMKQKCEAIIS